MSTDTTTFSDLVADAAERNVVRLQVAMGNLVDLVGRQAKSYLANARRR